MNNSKLLNILKLYTPEDIKQFGKFIASPYFSTGRDVRGLFSLLKNSYPHFASPELERRVIYSKLFKDSPFNERRLKNLTASLTHMAEDFLLHNYLYAGSAEKNLKLAEIFYKRGSEKLFQSALNHVEKESPQAYHADYDSYSINYKLLRLKEKYFISKNKYAQSIPLRLEYTEHSLLYHYINYFKRQKDKVIFPIFYNIPFENSLFDSVHDSTDFEALVRSLNLKKYSLAWLIEIYYNIYISIKDHSESFSETSYLRLKELFLLNIDKFNDGEKFYILDSMAAYCIMREPSNSAFTNECFEVYQKMLSEKAFKFNENDHIPITLYGNIMFWAYDMNKFEWLEKFIDEYSDELKPEFKEDMIHMARAHQFFGQGDFRKSLYHIERVQKEFLLYKIQVRNLKFKLYYELNLIEEAYSLLDSFKHFLKNNTEINELFKERANNLINIYVKLLKGRSDRNAIDLENLKSKIDNMLGYEMRPWLLEKLDQLVK